MVHAFDVDKPLPPSECDIEIMELAQALPIPPDPRPYLHPEPGTKAARHGGVGLRWAAGGWDPWREHAGEGIAAAGADGTLHQVATGRGS